MARAARLNALCAGFGVQGVGCRVGVMGFRV